MACGELIARFYLVFFDFEVRPNGAVHSEEAGLAVLGYSSLCWARPGGTAGIGYRFLGCSATSTRSRHIQERGLG